MSTTEWAALIFGFLVGAVGGFGFGWFVFDRFRARTLRAHLAELTYIDERLKVIQGKMLNNDADLTPAEVAEFISTQRYVRKDGKTEGRASEDSPDHLQAGADSQGWTDRYSTGS